MDTTPLKSRYATGNIGLNFFSAEDDTTKLDDVYDSETYGRYYDYEGQTLFSTGYAPKKKLGGNR